jgi:hypothetical protein
MDTLQTLGIALGLATLAGLNLYLTVFVTGLAIQQHWIDVSQTYPELAILAHPAILLISGILYAVEFFADKIPWVDSLWDTLHTIIRPVGGAMLAIRVLGTPDPVFDVIVGLLAGSVSMIVHSAKAGTRIVANHSPEPFSNIALSLTEDAAVVGGLALMRYSPELAFGVFVFVLALVCYLTPKLFRAVRVHVWLLWRKVVSPASDHATAELGPNLPPDLDVIFHKANLLGEKIVWAAPCVSTTARRIPGNLFGHLVATAEEPGKLWFIAKRGWRRLAEELDLATYKVVHEPKFLSENLVLYSLEKKPKYIFIFDRTQSAAVKAVAASLQERIARATPAPTVQPPAGQPVTLQA